MRDFRLAGQLVLWPFARATPPSSCLWSSERVTLGGYGRNVFGDEAGVVLSTANHRTAARGAMT